MAQKRVLKGQSSALEAVEARYGGVEDLAIAIFEVCPAFLGLDGDEMSLPEAAKALNLPVEAVGAAVSHPEFNRTLDRLAAYGEYDFGKRRVAMRNLAHVATTLQKTVMTRSGKAARVDRDADEMIKADSHLRKLQGQPLDEPKRAGGTGIQIIFGGASPDGGDTVDVRFHEGDDDDAGRGAAKDAGETEEEGPAVYQGNRRGALPPENARRFYRDGTEPPDPDRKVRPEFDFRGEESEEARGVGSVAAAKALARGDGPGGDPGDER